VSVVCCPLSVARCLLPRDHRNAVLHRRARHAVTRSTHCRCGPNADCCLSSAAVCTLPLVCCVHVVCCSHIVCRTLCCCMHGPLRAWSMYPACRRMLMSACALSLYRREPWHGPVARCNTLYYVATRCTTFRHAVQKRALARAHRALQHLVLRCNMLCSIEPWPGMAWHDPARLWPGMAWPWPGPSLLRC
jgi:hypothetical protein